MDRGYSGMFLYNEIAKTRKIQRETNENISLNIAYMVF